MEVEDPEVPWWTGMRTGDEVEKRTKKNSEEVIKRRTLTCVVRAGRDTRGIGLDRTEQEKPGYGLRDGLEVRSGRGKMLHVSKVRAHMGNLGSLCSYIRGGEQTLK